MIRSRQGVRGEGGSDACGVLIAEAGAPKSHASEPSLAPKAAPLIFASEVSGKTAMLADVNQALNDQIYVLVDDIREGD